MTLLDELHLMTKVSTVLLVVLILLLARIQRRGRGDR